jgi:hypothetical protein
MMQIDKTNKNHTSFVLEPSLKLIENWKLSIAKEIIMQLRSRTNVEIDISRIYSLVNPDNIIAFDCLWNDFEDYLLQAYQNGDFKDFDKLKFRLDREFDFQVVGRLSQIALEVEHRYSMTLEQYAGKNLQQLSPDRVVNLLKDVSQLLLMQRRSLENSKSFTEKKISSSCQSFRLLVSKGSGLKLESIFKALNLYFKSKYERERNVAFSKLVLGLMEIAQRHYNIASRSSLFLKTVEDSLDKKSSMKHYDLPVIMYLKPIDIDEQQSLIDSWLNKTIRFWQNGVSIEEFEQKILINVEDIAQELFYEFQIQFLENTVIKSTKHDREVLNSE